MVKFIKYIIFLEFLILLLCGITHLVLHLIGDEFPIQIYWIASIIIFGCLLLAIITYPIAEWFLVDN